MKKNKRNTNKIKKAVIMMFKDKIIEKIKAEIQKETRKKRRTLTKEEKNAIIRKVEKEQLRKINVKIAAGALATAIGITGVALLADGKDKDNEPETEKTETVETTNEKSFKESLKVDTQENYVTTENTTDSIEKNNIIKSNINYGEIYNLSSDQEVIAWLKDFYIEEYENVTGDEKLTTEDIKIVGSYQSCAFDLGEYVVTHAGNIEKTKELLEADKQEYTGKSNVYVYTIRLQNGTVIDAVTKDGKAVIPGDKYGTYDTEKSVAQYMGGIFNSAFEVLGNTKDKKAKSELANAVTEWDNQKQERESTNTQIEDTER